MKNQKFYFYAKSAEEAINEATKIMPSVIKGGLLYFEGCEPFPFQVDERQAKYDAVLNLLDDLTQIESDNSKPDNSKELDQIFCRVELMMKGLTK